MDYKIFFIGNNNGGHKTKEKFIKKHFPDLYEKISVFNTNELKELPFLQKVWHFINNVDHIPRCGYCDKQLKFKRSLNEGYGIFCSIPCANKSEIHIEKVKKTNNKLYGGNALISSESVKNKIKDTNIKKYGVDNIFRQSEYIKEKVYLKFGVTNASKLESTKEKVRNTNLERYNETTPLVLKSTQKKSQIERLKKFNKKYESLNVIINSGDTIEIVCNSCNQPYKIYRGLLRYRFDNEVNPCTICNPVNELVSIKEKEFKLFLTSLNIEFESNNRTILDGQEIDVYIPSHNIAIEFDGLYYHSDLFKPNDYHLNKTLGCESQGVQLIHIFEDEWDYKKEIVKNKIKNLLKVDDEIILTGEYIIKNVPVKEKVKFLNNNHIQGSLNSKINLGLYYNEELVSILTLNSLGDDKYELIQFCNKLNHNVIDGLPKLLNYFVGKYNPKEIISFIDIRWNNETSFKELGFELIDRTEPNYFYVSKRRRSKQLKTKNHMLVSEIDNELNSNVKINSNRDKYRIFDCGNLVYKKTFN